MSDLPQDAHHGGSPADLLSGILQGLRLEGVEYGRCRLGTTWAVAFPAQRAARFHFVSRGGSWLRTEAAGWVRLKPGDAVLLPRGSFHVLASAPDVPAVDIGALEPFVAPGDIDLAQGPGEAAPGDVMFCGALRFNLDPLHPLIAMMPEVMHAAELAQRDPTVPALLEAMEREVALDRIGSNGILARLADVVAASIIRAWVECACGNPAGWIAALRCPKIGKVLAAIHAQPERDWGVPALAQLMGASRSSFADAFTRTVGESPARYVGKIRMFQARRWIAEEGLRISVVADRLGYDSEASFSRAFKRVIGHPPSAARAERPAAGGRALAQPGPQAAVARPAEAGRATGKRRSRQRMNGVSTTR